MEVSWKIHYSIQSSTPLFNGVFEELLALVSPALSRIWRKSPSGRQGCWQVLHWLSAVMPHILLQKFDAEISLHLVSFYVTKQLNCTFVLIRRQCFDSFISERMLLMYVTLCSFAVWGTSLTCLQNMSACKLLFSVEWSARHDDVKYA